MRRVAPNVVLCSASFDFLFGATGNMQVFANADLINTGTMVVIKVLLGTLGLWTLGEASQHIDVPLPSLAWLRSSGDLEGWTELVRQSTPLLMVLVL